MGVIGEVDIPNNGGWILYEVVEEIKIFAFDANLRIATIDCNIKYISWSNYSGLGGSHPYLQQIQVRGDRVK